MPKDMSFSIQMSLTIKQVELRTIVVWESSEGNTISIAPLRGISEKGWLDSTKVPRLFMCDGETETAVETSSAAKKINNRQKLLTVRCLAKEGSYQSN